jgi:thiol:disulfide interchange protein
MNKMDKIKKGLGTVLKATIIVPAVVTCWLVMFPLVVALTTLLGVIFFGESYAARFTLFLLVISGLIVLYGCATSVLSQQPQEMPGENADVTPINVLES